MRSLLMLLCCLHISLSTRHLKMGLRSYSHSSQIEYDVKNFCNQYLDLSAEGRQSSGILDLNILLRDSFSNFSCDTTLRAPQNYRVLISLRKIEIFVRGHCSDYITVFDGELNSTDPVANRICGYYDANHAKPISYYSRLSSMLTIKSFKEAREIKRHVTEDEDIIYNFGFTVIATVFNRSRGGKCLGNDQMFCDNGFCIWKHLKCNGYNNCGDGSDEKECGIDAVTESPEPSTLRFPAALAAVLVVGILMIMIIAAVIILFHKKRPSCCAVLFPVRPHLSIREQLATISSTTDSRNQPVSGGYDNDAFLEDLPPPYHMFMNNRHIQSQNGDVNDLPNYHEACAALHIETSTIKANVP